MSNKRRLTDLNEKPQHERFKEAARELGLVEDEEAIERVFGKIVPPAKGDDKKPDQTD